MEDCSSLEHCIFLRNLRFLSVAGIKHGICVTTDLEELNLYGDDCDRYDLQERVSLDDLCADLASHPIFWYRI